MTPEAVRIAKEALELAEKATPGPWTDVSAAIADLPDGATEECGISGPQSVTVIGSDWWSGQHLVLREPDALLIAFARTALPILARAVLESHIVEQERDTWLRLEMAAVEHVQDTWLSGGELVEALAEVDRVRQDRGEASRNAEQERADVVAFLERWSRDPIGFTEAERAILGSASKAFACGQHVGAAAKAGPK